MHTNSAHLRVLFDYTRSADERMLAAAEKLPADAVRKELNISAGSVLKLLVHQMGAQWLWLQRWQGNTEVKLPDAAAYADVGAIKARWAEVHNAIAAFIDAQSPESLNRRISYRGFGGVPASLPLGWLILHALDHSTYHRGQLNSMVKLAGGQPLAQITFSHYLLTRSDI